MVFSPVAGVSSNYDLGSSNRNSTAARARIDSDRPRLDPFRPEGLEIF